MYSLGIKPDVQRELFQQEIIVRGGAFQREILSCTVIVAVFQD